MKIEIKMWNKITYVWEVLECFYYITYVLFEIIVLKNNVQSKMLLAILYF